MNNKIINEPSNFKLLFKGRDTHEYLLNNEDYITPSGLTFNLVTTGNILTEAHKEPDFSLYPKCVGFYYIKTDVYHNGNLLTGEQGISGKKGYGYNFELPGSVRKVRKWLDNNGEKLIQGKQYQHKST